MDLNEAAVFVKVVQAGSFSAAARLLGLPTSTVSTRISRLEARLGMTLLQRTTRRLHLTEVGELYFRHASTGLSHMLNAEAAVIEAVDEPQGLLRVTAPADIGDRILAEIVNLMRQATPKVSIEMVLMDRYADLIAEGIDVAIRIGNLKDSTLIAKSVGIARWGLFASPIYFSSRPALASPQELRRNCCLQFTPLGKDAWTLANNRDSITVPMSGQVMVNDTGMIHSMALAGEGIALLPIYLCRQDCENGKLMRILPEWHARTDPVHIVYPRQRFMPSKLRIFIDVAHRELQRRLDAS